MVQRVCQFASAVIFHECEDGKGLADKKFPRFSHAVINKDFPVETAVHRIEQRFQQVRIPMFGCFQIVSLRRTVTKTVRSREYPEQASLRNQTSRPCFFAKIPAAPKQETDQPSPVRPAITNVEQLIASHR